MAEQSTSIPDLASLLEEAQAQKEKIDRDLEEIKILIQQSENEAERMAQRNAQAANLLRQIESHPEGYSREETVNAYASSQDAQLRLFTMRSQVEQLQNREAFLKTQSEQLSRWLAIGERLDLRAGGAPSSPSPNTELGERTIVGIIEAQEGERQRLARQMHDGPAQSLTNLILQAEVCERLFDSDPAQARAELANLKAAVHNTFQRTRRFIFDLRPMMLDDLGLLPTLRRYVQDFQEKSGLAIDLRITGQERRLASHTEVTIFRVIQELLINIDLHAHAHRVQVALGLQPDKVRIVVEDDGSGFDVQEALAAVKQRKTLGLAALQERVELLGGTASFESRIGRGTKVTIEIPAP
ncbi:MAG: sensor histidine kinase [Chloroflexi bacterium]|nr:sensor histidine kinase [Chloroflexota bacterium]